MIKIELLKENIAYSSLDIRTTLKNMYLNKHLNYWGGDMKILAKSNLVGF